jgi:hypothetical protein
VFSLAGFTALQVRDFDRPALDKPSARLYPIDIERMGWEPPGDGSSEGVTQKILVRSPSGSVTRLVHADPYGDSGVWSHDFCEEVFIFEGSMKAGDEFHPAGTFTCKGPHVDHGPFLTNDGFLALEVWNYE